MTSTLLAYEMNGKPLPLEHGYPLRALALGWTGANCVKWLQKITVMDRPFEGFFMDNVYRVFQKGQDPKTGEVMTRLNVKSIIMKPLTNDAIPAGKVTVLGAAYAGEIDIQSVELSTDKGKNWDTVIFTDPHEPYAWRHWKYIWEVSRKGMYTIMSRATDIEGHRQPINAQWNVLGYGNNGVLEHAVNVDII
jgi:DMSO/TMAO reductase YedYZ molybdopterin-dependent catalytic subunit